MELFLQGITMLAFAFAQGLQDWFRWVSAVYAPFEDMREHIAVSLAAYGAYTRNGNYLKLAEEVDTRVTEAAKILEAVKGNIRPVDAWDVLRLLKQSHLCIQIVKNKDAEIPIPDISAAEEKILGRIAPSFLAIPQSELLRRMRNEHMPDEVYTLLAAKSELCRAMQESRHKEHTF